MLVGFLSVLFSDGQKELLDITRAIPNPNGGINCAFREFVIRSKNGRENEMTLKN